MNLEIIKFNININKYASNYTIKKDNLSEF